MIKPGEIQKKATKVGVRDQQIEKDYVISWILQGIAVHDKLSRIIVFKGGTVLKKAYFMDYRFSEDLDFTLYDSTISNQQIYTYFKTIFEYVKEETNIPLEIYGLNIEFYINEFKNKCITKKLNPNDFFEKLEQRLPQYKARWQKSIKDQIKELPEFMQVERETKKHLRKLEV